MLARTLIQQSETIGAAKPRAILGAPAEGSHDIALDGMLLDQSMPKRKPLDIMISIGVHTAMIAAVIVAPIIFAQKLVLAHNEVTMLMPTVPMAPPPPMAAGHAVLSTSKAAFTAPKLTTPVAIPKITQVAPNSSVSAPDLYASAAGVVGGSPDGVLGGLLGNGGVGSIAAPGQVGALHVGGQVQRPELVYNPEPEYPKQAKKNKIQGDVKIDAVIDRDGNVIQAHVISGPPELVEAALKAVTQQKYEPTYLNGSPVPLELVVDMNFSLG